MPDHDTKLALYRFYPTKYAQGMAARFLLCARLKDMSLRLHFVRIVMEILNVILNAIFT